MLFNFLAETLGLKVEGDFRNGEERLFWENESTSLSDCECDLADFF
jgi:hypothetical protein